MKRLITCLFGFALLCSVGFAKDFSNGISNGGFFILDGNYCGGYGEWSFPILKTEKNFMIRNNITLGGFGAPADGKVMGIGGFTVGDKILYGSICNNSDVFVIRTYGLLGIDVSMFGTENHPVFSPSAILGSTFGGGFEFQYDERSSFVIEFGGKYRYVIGENMSLYKQFNSINPIISIGFRSYLENRNKSR